MNRRKKALKRYAKTLYSIYFVISNLQSLFFVQFIITYNIISTSVHVIQSLTQSMLAIMRIQIEYHLDLDVIQITKDHALNYSNEMSKINA